VHNRQKVRQSPLPEKAIAIPLVIRREQWSRQIAGTKDLTAFRRITRTRVYVSRVQFFRIDVHNPFVNVDLPYRNIFMVHELSRPRKKCVLAAQSV